MFRKEEQSTTDHLSFHLRQLEREEPLKLKASRRKIMKITMGINEIKKKKTPGSS